MLLRARLQVLLGGTALSTLDALLRLCVHELPDGLQRVARAAEERGVVCELEHIFI